MEVWGVWLGKELLSSHTKKDQALKAARLCEYLSVGKEEYKVEKISIESPKCFYYPGFIKVDFEAILYVLADDTTKICNIKTSEHDEDAIDITLYKKTSYYNAEEALYDLLYDPTAEQQQTIHEREFYKKYLGKVKLLSKASLKLYGESIEIPPEEIHTVDTGIPADMILYEFDAKGYVVVDSQFKTESREEFDKRIIATIRGYFKEKVAHKNIKF